MNTPPDPADEPLRDLLREMEQAQEKHAPPFPRMWRAATTPRETKAGERRRAWPVPGLAVAAALVLVAALWWSRPATEGPVWEAQLAAFEQELDMLPLPDAAPEPEAWKLPTDFLLADADDQNFNRTHR